jgi:hypothetical protein
METENPHFDLIALNPPGVFGFAAANYVTDSEGNQFRDLRNYPKSVEVTHFFFKTLIRI